MPIPFKGVCRHWGKCDLEIQSQYTADATMLVLASDPYDGDDYFRDYHLFLKERAAIIQDSSPASTS